METGNLFGRLLESSKGGLMVAWTKMPEVEVVRNGQIHGIFWR